MDQPIIHNIAEERFEYVQDNMMAFLEYRQKGEVMALVHTEVPPALEGKGIAAKLVQYVLEYVRANHFKIIPYCAYVKAYLKRHPEYNDLVKS